MYISRAHPLTLSWEYLPVPNADAGDFVDYVKREVCKEVRRIENTNDGDAQILEALKSWRSVYIGLPEVPPPDDLAGLRDAFPKATFIFDAGPEPGHVDGMINVTSLRPELDTDLESKQFSSFNEAERIIRRRR
jgi:hypothetical protein